MTAADLEWDLGDRIRKACRISGKRNFEIADELEISMGTLGNWAAGRSNPTKADLLALAAVTGVPFEWLSPAPKASRGTAALRGRAGKRHFTDNKNYGRSLPGGRPDNHSYRQNSRPSPSRPQVKDGLRNRDCPNEALYLTPLIKLEMDHASLGGSHGAWPLETTKLGVPPK